MPALLAALDAFVQEHRRCGELDGGVDGERVWMACDCGASVAQPIHPPESLLMQADEVTRPFHRDGLCARRKLKGPEAPRPEIR